MIGERLGNYRIVRQLGEGGMGVVYLAEHEHLGRRAAVKVLHAALGQSLEALERFLAEAQATAALRHPGIVDIYDCGFHGAGRAYIAMEYLEGQSLGRFLWEQGRVTLPQAVLVGQQIAAAVGAAHEHRLVHRDLKPENIFLVERRLDRVKVLDFGIAKLLGDAPGSSRRTRTGTVLGTPAYMSPEQCRGTGEIDHRSDIYSLGCVIYEMVCGRVPFTYAGTGELIAAHLSEPPPPPRSFGVVLPPSFEALLVAMLSKSPGDRPPSMNALAHELGRLAEEQPGSVSPAGTSRLTIPPAASASHLGGTPSSASAARTIKLAAVPKEGASSPGESEGRQPDTTLGGAAKSDDRATSPRRPSFLRRLPGLLPLFVGGIIMLRAFHGFSWFHLPTWQSLRAITRSQPPPMGEPVRPAQNGEPAKEAVTPTKSATRGAASQDGRRTHPGRLSLAAIARNPPFSHKPRTFPPLPGKTDAMTAGLNRLVDCLNTVSARARSSFDRYHSWVRDLEVGPTGKERNVYGLYTLTGVDSCHQNIGEFAGSTPHDVEQAAVTYDQAMKSLDGLTEVADRYYEHEDYKDDGFAQGRKLHGAIVTAFHVFSDADMKLRRAIEARGAHLRKSTLAAGDDGSARASKDRLLDEAEGVMNAGEEGAQDPDRLGARVTAYEQALARARQRGQSENAQETMPWWAPFMREADDFLAAAKRRVRSLRSGDRFSDTERRMLAGGGGWMVKGSVPDLARMYERLVEAARHLNPL